MGEALHKKRQKMKLGFNGDAKKVQKPKAGSKGLAQRY